MWPWPGSRGKYVAGGRRCAIAYAYASPLAKKKTRDPTAQDALACEEKNSSSRALHGFLPTFGFAVFLVPCLTTAAVVINIPPVRLRCGTRRRRGRRRSPSYGTTTSCSSFASTTTLTRALLDAVKPRRSTERMTGWTTAGCTTLTLGCLCRADTTVSSVSLLRIFVFVVLEEKLLPFLRGAGCVAAWACRINHTYLHRASFPPSCDFFCGYTLGPERLRYARRLTDNKEICSNRVHV